MYADADLAAVAELMSGRRAPLMLALLGGQPLSAGELARRAGISPSLASNHLSRLLDGGLIAVTQRGRRREYRIAGEEVAAAVEGLLQIAPGRAPRGLRETTRADALRRGRTCYDHLAGKVGVAITESLQRRGLLDEGFALTDAGEQRMTELGLDLDDLRARQRAFTRPCLDWTERRPHLAGALGAAIAGHALERDWLERVPETRAVRVTERGTRGLRDAFGLDL